MCRIRMYLSVVFLITICSNGWAQNTFQEIIEDNPFKLQRSIVNGVSWTNSVLYKGNRFCGSSNWKKGEVLLGDKLYKDVLINYDVVDNELILFDDKVGDEKYVKLNKELVSKFQYTDNKELKTFVKRTLPNTKGEDFYEEVFKGTVSFYIKHKKSVNKEIGTVYMGKLYDSNTLYLVDKNGANTFHSKKKLTQLLGNSKLLKKYIREHNLSINKENPSDIVLLLNYNEELTQSNNVASR